MSKKSRNMQKGVIGLVVMVILSVLVIFLAESLGGKGEKVSLQDGSYQVESPEFVNGYKDIVSMEVVGGKITRLSWDAVDEAGASKTQLSKDGDYIMTESNPRWHEQSEDLASFVIEHQSIDGLAMDESGKTDAVASVSINIQGFVSLVKECIKEASK